MVRQVFFLDADRQRWLTLVVFDELVPVCTGLCAEYIAREGLLVLFELQPPYAFLGVAEARLLVHAYVPQEVQLGAVVRVRLGRVFKKVFQRSLRHGVISQLEVD